MISKDELKKLIKSIKDNTGKTQAEISQGAGYKPKTLTQLLSKDEDLEPAYNRLKLVYQNGLNSSTYAGNIDASLRAISSTLQRIENGQAYIRAEVRGYGQYQIMEKAGWDQQKFLKLMEKVGTLIGANLQADDEQGNQ